LLKVALNTITTTPYPSLQTIKHNKVKLRHPGPRLRQARKCGRVKSVNGITILDKFIFWALGLFASVGCTYLV
jgi:hypothetical protein